MASTKPAIVIVPGAYYEQWHYRHLHAGLESAGYAVTTVSLPSVGGEHPQRDQQADIAAIASAIQQYLSVDKDVVLVMHSYGGIPGGSACKGLLPADTKNGRGVVGLIYISAGLSLEGITVIDSIGGKHFPWTRLVAHQGNTEPSTGIWLACDDPANFFFYDCPPDVQDEAVRRLRYWSESCMWDQATFSPWKTVASCYLLCTEDRSLSVSQQEDLVAFGEAQMDGGTWKKVGRVASGHSPFLSKPKETIDFVRECIEEHFSDHVV